MIDAYGSSFEKHSDYQLEDLIINSYDDYWFLYL